MSDIRLKNCPFCGWGATVAQDIGSEKYRAGCVNLNCYVKTQEYDTEQDAIKAWNTRADVRKRGEWIDRSGFIMCSVCGEEAYWDTDYGQQLFDYCPYCGAEMRGDKNER